MSKDKPYLKKKEEKKECTIKYTILSSTDKTLFENTKTK